MIDWVLKQWRVLRADARQKSAVEALVFRRIQGPWRSCQMGRYDDDQSRTHGPGRCQGRVWRCASCSWRFCANEQKVMYRRMGLVCGMCAEIFEDSEGLPKS